MEASPERPDRRALLDAKLTDLGLYAKELCSDARVEISVTRYEDEDGRVAVFPPPTLSEEEEERIELALCARAADVFDETGLFIVCGILDAPNGGRARFQT